MSTPVKPPFAVASLLVAFVAIAGCIGPPTAAVNPTPPPPAVHGTFTAAFVDVGQGDGVVFTLPDGSVVVYDCGPPAANSSVNPVNAYLRSTGHPAGSKLWALVASHGHLDHMGGCEEVLADYEVEHIYEAWYEGPDAPVSYNRWITEVIAENATVHTARETPFLSGEQVFHQGDALVLPQGAADDGLRVHILWPPATAPPTWNEVGLFSIVLRWSFGAVDFCTDGDIEKDQEAALAASPEDLNCEVYLVGHHGSSYSSSAAWLDKMHPKTAVVSFGENDYGHPTPEALCRVQSAGARVFATHRLGTVTVATDGTTTTTSPDRPETQDYCKAGASYWPSPAPPPPPPPPPPSAGLALTAAASSTDPCQYTTVTVVAHASRGGSPVSGASVTSNWYYKTSTPTVAGTTDASGEADLSRYISGASAGYEVVVDVSATEGGETASASASFTPRAC